MTTDQDFAGLRLRGNRESQQDYYAFCPVEPVGDAPAGLLLVLADGAGGLAAGALASQRAVEGFIDAFFAVDSAGSARLTAALDAANRQVAEIGGAAAEQWEDASSASTLVAAHVTAEWFEWISVGDSLLLHVRDCTPLWRNVDHSLRHVDGAAAPNRNALLSALTGGPIPLVDAGRLPWQSGDGLVAGSDGLLSITEKEMAAVATRTGWTALQCVQSLAQSVLDTGNPRQDNVTVAVLHNRFQEASARRGQPVST